MTTTRPGRSCLPGGVRRTSAAALIGSVALLAACAAPTANPSSPAAAPAGSSDLGKSVTLIRPADRTPASVLSGPALAGDGTVSTTGHAPKVVVVNVWGSWCAPCRKEAPDLVSVANATTKSAQFIGVDIRDPDRAPAQAFTRTFKVPYPSIYDPDGQQLVKLANAMSIAGIPTTLVVDPQGRTAAKIVGIVTVTTLTEIIADVAAGR